MLLASTSLGVVVLARVVSGLGIGIITATATAHLTELHATARPEADRARAGYVATAANLGGLAAGPLVSGLLAQYVDGPLRTRIWSSSRCWCSARPVSRSSRRRSGRPPGAAATGRGGCRCPPPRGPRSAPPRPRPSPPSPSSACSPRSPRRSWPGRCTTRPGRWPGWWPSWCSAPPRAARPSWDGSPPYANCPWGSPCWAVA
ncbi:hypothetical protein NKH77_36505 [Streptomyces sp. M19]